MNRPGTDAGIGRGAPPSSLLPGVQRLLKKPKLRLLLAHIREVPALNIQELSAAAGVRRTAANHHIHRLIRAGLVATLRQGPHVLHFSIDIPQAQRVALSLLRIPSVRATARHCFHNPAFSPSDLAKELEVSPRTIYRALKLLEDQGLLQVERNGPTSPGSFHLHPELRLAIVNWIFRATEPAGGEPTALASPEGTP